MLAEKIRNASFFDEDFEVCAEKFVQERLLSRGTLQQALEVSAQEMETRYSQAWAYYQRDQYVEATPIFRELVNLNPFEPKFWKGLGACLQMVDKPEEALRCYAVLAYLDGQDAYVHYHAYECLVATNQPQEAAQALVSCEKVADPELRKLVKEAQHGLSRI